MQLCQRCQAHPAEVIFGDLSVCTPCAETMAWSMGIPFNPTQQAEPEPVAYAAAGDIFPISPFDIGRSATRRALGMPPEDKKPDGFPFVRVMFVLGGVAVVGVVGLMAVNAFKTANVARETIQKHPELLAGL